MLVQNISFVNVLHGTYSLSSSHGYVSTDKQQYRIHAQHKCVIHITNVIMYIISSAINIK